MGMTHASTSNTSDSAPAEPQERPHPLAVGHRLDEFELLEVIGEGGFGIVYRAYDHSLQREVAIKEYMPSMLARRVGDDSVHVRSDRVTATFQAGLRSFINEARTLAQFSHPALVRVHRFWEANSTAYMAIQLYRGRTLRRLAEEEPAKISEAWLLGMLGPLLGALETLHRSQCFHRDIAPDNIFIQQDDMPVLLDFGAARKSIADLVDEVAVMVKSGYSPIEQYADDNTLLQGAWTDLYALGAVLYRAVTGHPPPSAVVRSVQDAYVPLSSLGRGDLSPGFCAAVDHTLAVHSKDRTQTVAAFAAELGLAKLGDTYVSGLPAPAAIVPPPSKAAPAATPGPQQQAPAAAAPEKRAAAPQSAASAEAVQARTAVPTPVEAKSIPKADAGSAAKAAPTPSPKAAAPARAPSAAARQHQPAASSPDKKTSSRPPWGLVGVLLIALVAVGSWIGLHLSSWKQETSTAMAPVPPPSKPMTADAPPPAAAPPGVGGAAPAGGNVAAAPGALTPPAPGASAPAASLTPLDKVPVIAPAPSAQANAPDPSAPPAPATPVPQGPSATTPEAALATGEVEDWNLAQAENTREGYEAYLRRYRRGLHVREARNAIAELNRLSTTVPAPPGTTPTNAVPTVVAGGATPPGAPSVTAPAAPPGMGRVVLNIRPWGQVFVDGAERGVSPPLKSLSLRPGIYNIEVRNGDLDVYRQRVTVQDSKSAPVVSHEFK